MGVNTAFQWECQPAAEQLLMGILAEAKRLNRAIAELEERLYRLTSTRLFDWMDYLAVGRSKELEKQLVTAGFATQQTGVSYRVWHHPAAKLPALVVYDEGPPLQGVAVLVESITSFLMARSQSARIEGAPFSPLRRCRVASQGGVALIVVERRGTRLIEPIDVPEGYLDRYFWAVEQWQTRPRKLEDEDEAITRVLVLAQELAMTVGTDVAACIVAEVERAYWQQRNTAAQIQKNRQDRLGMGWANHDHHTFRSSRRHFSSLVRLFEILGFHCRERFYAGQEAGWGAQVMENEGAGLVLFLDVDLAEDEIVIDFAHQPLPEREQLGTIGLWCALHGDSILQAGMHHLEAQFLFDELTQDMGSYGVKMMEPFSNFPYLKQAFTQGDLWLPESARVDRLLKAGKITQEQAEKFRTQGAIGSHLENLQRREGYKGFNQKNVSFIIRKTDPRTAHTSTLLGD